MRTPKNPARIAAACVFDAWLMHINGVGGSAGTEVTAVAVQPKNSAFVDRGDHAYAGCQPAHARLEVVAQRFARNAGHAFDGCREQRRHAAHSATSGMPPSTAAAFMRGNCST
ncbi:hypothetical protein [Variovorax sp. H27-G14]|uniref:hypothetical protein n=1 Tax=Variovorax sp. H27-G14 TaxID=3111914 RepID=UPI0038FCC2AC